MVNRSPDALTGLVDGLLGPEGCLKISNFQQLLQLSQIVVKLPQNTDPARYYAKIVAELKELLPIIAQDTKTQRGPNVSKFLSILTSNLTLVAPDLIGTIFKLPSTNHAETILIWRQVTVLKTFFFRFFVKVDGPE